MTNNRQDVVRPPPPPSVAATFSIKKEGTISNSLKKIQIFFL